MSFDILSFGTMYLDINSIDFPFGEGLLPEQDTVGGQYHLVPGGSALNFARMCAALELKPLFIGKVGQDIISEMLLKLIEKESITADLIIDPQVQTNISQNFTDPRGRTLMASIGTANQALTVEEVTQKVTAQINQVKVVYLGGVIKLAHLLPAYQEIVRQAKAADKLIVIDHGRINPSTMQQDIDAVKQIIAQADVYLPSYQEFLDVFEAIDLDEAYAAFSQISSAQLAVKNSHHGAHYWQDGQLQTVPAHQVDVIDAIGAGDAFNAGSIAEYLRSNNSHNAVIAGNASAALKISQDTLPTPKQVAALQKELA